MNRRDFIKLAGLIPGSILLTPSLAFASDIFNTSSNQISKQSKIPKFGFPENKIPEVGMWYYPLFFNNSVKHFDLNLLNETGISVMKKYGVNTCYIGGSDMLVLHPPNGKWGSWKKNFGMLSSFSRACDKSGIETAMIGFEDHHFIDEGLYSNRQLQSRFRNWIQRTKDFSQKYQIDLEPHGYDAKTNGMTFRGNKKNRKIMLSRFIDICDMFYNIAEKEGVFFSPAIPLIDSPSVKEDKKKMNYDVYLKEAGFKGFDAIPNHFLTLMSYTWSANDLETLVQNKLKGIKSNFVLSSSNYVNEWDPFFEEVDEFSKVPKVIYNLRKDFPNLNGHLLFTNLSLPEFEDIKKGAGLEADETKDWEGKEGEITIDDIVIEKKKYPRRAETIDFTIHWNRNEKPPTELYAVAVSKNDAFYFVPTSQAWFKDIKWKKTKEGYKTSKKLHGSKMYVRGTEYKFISGQMMNISYPNVDLYVSCFDPSKKVNLNCGNFSASYNPIIYMKEAYSSKKLESLVSEKKELKFEK